MASEWQVSPLETLPILLIDGDRSSRYPKREEYLSAGTFIFLNADSISSGRIDLGKVNYLPSQKYAELSKGRLQQFDVVLTMRGNGVGKVAFYDIATPGLINAQMLIIRPDPRHIDPRYLYLYLSSPAVQQTISGFVSGSAQPQLTITHLKRLSLTLPPLAEQREIAHILGSLDDKIELNRRMNATLEATARALFQSWFVDFDPVRTKAEGRDPDGMDAETAALFPDSFEESELGAIPSGWEVGTLQDVAENPRRSVNPVDMDEGTFYIGLEHMPQKSIALSDWGMAADVDSNKYAFYQGEYLFGKLRPYFHKVGIAPLDGICSTDILVVSPCSDEWGSYILMHLSSDLFIDFTVALSGGTRMPRTSWKDMSRYTVVIPPAELAAQFHTQIAPMTDRIIANIHESRTLAETRDALLPKLISGEVTP